MKLELDWNLVMRAWISIKKSYSFPLFNMRLPVSIWELLGFPYRSPMSWIMRRYGICWSQYVAFIEMAFVDLTSSSYICGEKMLGKENRTRTKFESELPSDWTMHESVGKYSFHWLQTESQPKLVLFSLCPNMPEFKSGLCMVLDFILGYSCVGIGI